MRKKRKSKYLPNSLSWSDTITSTSVTGHWGGTTASTTIRPLYLSTISPYRTGTNATMMDHPKTKIGGHIVSKFVSLKEMDDRIIIALENNAGEPFSIHINNNRPKNILTEIRAFINECGGDCPGCLFRRTCMSGYYVFENNMCYDNGGDTDDMKKVLNNMVTNNRGA